MNLDENLSLEQLIELYSFADLYVEPKLFKKLGVRDQLTDRILHKLAYLYLPYMYLYEEYHHTYDDELADYMNCIMEKMKYEDLYKFRDQAYKGEDTAVYVIRVGKTLPQEEDMFSYKHAKNVIEHLIQKTKVIEEFKLSDDLLHVLETMNIKASFLNFLKGEIVIEQTIQEKTFNSNRCITNSYINIKIDS
jgi:hypothetical protein